MSDLVYIHQNKCWTDSKKLAKKFDKRHDDVMKKIQWVVNVMQDLDFVERNFEKKNGSTLGATAEMEYYELTRDAFYLVAMELAGTESVAFRIKLIEEFNRMGDELEMREQPTISTEDLLQRAIDKIDA